MIFKSNILFIVLYNFKKKGIQKTNKWCKNIVQTFLLTHSQNQINHKVDSQKNENEPWTPSFNGFTYVINVSHFTKIELW